MARKKPAIKHRPPVDSSEEEEEEEEEVELEGGEQNGTVEEEEEEEEEEEDEETPVKRSAANPSVDDDSDSDTETTDTQPSPTASAFTIKPRDGLATAVSTAAASKRTIASKRKAEEDPQVEETESKLNSNGKKKSKAAAGSTGRGGSEGGGKKGTGTTQRLWSEDDEIALLKGTNEYRRIKGSDPSADIGGYYEFIKKSLDLSFELSKPQLVDKIYRLKKKFKANVEKAGNDDPVFTKPHEQRAFDLSKKIWGPEATIHNGSGVDNAKSNTSKTKEAKISTSASSLPPLGVTLALPNRKNPILHFEKKVTGEARGNVAAVMVTEAEAEAEAGIEKKNGGKVESDFWSKFLPMSLSLDLEEILGLPEFGKNFMSEIMSVVRSDKAMELEAKWRDLQEKELQLFLKRIDLVKLQAQLALDVMRASRP